MLHRDVKGDNVLVSHDQSSLWLADFNTAHQLMAGGSLTMTGTWEYSPPEVLVGGANLSRKSHRVQVSLLLRRPTCGARGSVDTSCSLHAYLSSALNEKKEDICLVISIYIILINMLIYL